MERIERLLEIMARLRDPEAGCPWDRAQTFATIAPYTVEEAYEVADAIERGAMVDLKEELGDLLFQVVFHARMAQELGHFDFHDVVETLNDKMVRRHPHVFGASRIEDAAAQTAAWERQKADERAAKVDAGQPHSVLDGVVRSLPALVLAEKLQKRVARVGFDWSGPQEVLSKLDEELGELEQARALGEREAVAAEIGDLLFTVVNLARHLDVKPEEALRGTCNRFEQRFRSVERRLAEQGSSPQEASLQLMDALWEQSKEEESG